MNFPFHDFDVPRRPSNGVYISQLIRVVRTLQSIFKFYTRHYALIETCQSEETSATRYSNPEFYGDLDYNFKKII